MLRIAAQSARGTLLILAVVQAKKSHVVLTALLLKVVLGGPLGGISYLYLYPSKCINNF